MDQPKKRYNNTRGGIGDTIEITEYVGVLGLPWTTWYVYSDGTPNISEEKKDRANEEKE